MQATLNTLPDSNTLPATNKVMLWTGRVLSTLAVLFLLMDGAIKLFNIQPVIDASMLLGLPLDLAPKVGVLMLVLLVVYLLPRTAVLGAVLLTGYLGGAIAIQVRVNAPLFSILFPIILGALLWGGLYLRNRTLRAFLAQPW